LTSIIERRFSLHQRLARQEEENKELRAQNHQLQALATLGSATSMIAHEINNLLTPLGTYAALAVQNPQDKELAERVLARTVRNCQRASKIMESMLQMANGRQQEWEETNVEMLVDDVFTCLCRDFEKDGIAVIVDVPAGLRLRCVAVQIQQVLMNLILNARDAMLPGGGTLRVSAVRDSQDVVIEVRDTGRGIAAENLRNIFKPFFTTKSTGECATAHSGSGVGLAFCRRVVDAHTGRIDVESESGRGTTFSIRLPQS
jgi:signal transduction histidine kinase